MRTVANAAIINYNKQLLMVKKRDTWILPGGKHEPGEDDLECLCREVSEELSGTKLKDISHYANFEGKTPHKGDTLKTFVYHAKIDGPLNIVAKEDSISEVKWINDFHNYEISDITDKVIESLKTNKYL